jgi:hypothetical protein
VGIVKADSGSGAGFHTHFMPCFAQGTHPGRGQADAEFMVFNFPGDADTHVFLLLQVCRAKKISD